MSVLSCLVFCLFASVSLAANTGILVLLKDAVKEGAACLDGTPPAYYFQQGTGTGANKWQVHHEGGGWCESLADCFGRSKTTLGSSSTYAQTAELPFGYLSNDPSVNPQMYNWNKVYLKYCDGGSFAGNNATVTNYNGNNLYFRGFLNLQAYSRDLYTNHALRQATDVVIGGCSAGGLATYLHVDWWHAILPASAKVVGLPDSGFFLDYNAPSGKPAYGTAMRWVFAQNNATAGVNQRCIQMNPSDKARCYFAEYTSPFIATQFLPLQSEYDSWQTGNILGSNDPSAINGFGTLLTSRFQTNVLGNKANGGFLDSCYHHCNGWSIKIKNENAAVVFQRWYQGGQGVSIAALSYPCAPCCVATHTMGIFEHQFSLME